jgi:hypothetical protein
MNFLQLLTHLEEHLGSHQLPLNPRATGLRDLFDGIGLHHPLMQKVVRAIYEQNGCRRLTDPVSRLATLNALGPIRLEMLRAHSTDVDLYRLLEELCVAAADAFTDDKPVGTPALTKPQTGHPRPADLASIPPVKPRAQVIQLEPFRRRRRLTASRI